MKSFEIEALRRLLFFSVPEAAALVGGVSEQAWRRWESGARAVPGDVAQRLRGLAMWRDSAIATAKNQVRDAPADVVVALIWYGALDDWASLAGREPALWRPQQSVVAALVTESPRLVKLVSFDVPAYAAWLGGRSDSEALRGQWAATVES